MAKQSKQKILAELIARMEASAATGHHLQAAWYASAIIEDRLVSILRTSGGVGKSAGAAGIRMIRPKLIELDDRAGRGARKVGLLADLPFVEIDEWREQRNDLMHEMADGKKSIAEIDGAAEILATEGAKFARALAIHARRLKKHSTQTPSVTSAASVLRSSPKAPPKKGKSQS